MNSRTAHVSDALRIAVLVAIGLCTLTASDAAGQTQGNILVYSTAHCPGPGQDTKDWFDSDLPSVLNAHGYKVTV